MNVFTKWKRIMKSAAVTGTTLALVLTPTAALAHGGGQDDSNSDSSRRTAVAQQKNKNDNRWSDWSNRNKHRQQLTCDERQAALNQKAADAKTKYEKRLTGLNIIYSGVQTYVSSGGIVVENYDAMNATVTADQTAATNAVNAIAAPDLNCDDQNAAAATSDDNKTFHDRDNSTNDSINAAREAVNTYRKDLNKLFEAVINS